MKFNKYTLLLAGGLTLGLTSCNDFLDREPMDAVTPDAFLKTESDMTAYALQQYKGAFTVHEGAGIGAWASDNHTDNQATGSYSNIWVPGEWLVNDHYGDAYKDDPWHFERIYNCNYFLERVVPGYAEDVPDMEAVKGMADGIKHCIGEIYFLRAWDYFKRLKRLGDFPIVTHTLQDESSVLTEASRRQPRHKVARFILGDLDTAIELLSNTPNGGTNRITKNAAYLLKSRVALYEASWETYHAGTALVPNGSGYPGGQVEYNASQEIAFFLTQCKEASQAVIDAVPLTQNNHVWADGGEKMNNPYFAQFSADDMSAYPEILFWKDYALDLSIMHSAGFYIRVGGNSGFTRQFVETFLMKSGLPIYADSNYKGDKSMDAVRDGRDERLTLFMLNPGEVYTTGQTEFEDVSPDLPNIFDTNEKRCVTGYPLRKGLSNNWSRDWNQSQEGCPIFRAAEAYLNYIEASCIENSGNSISPEAAEYWGQLRSRAGLPSNYNITVDATNLDRESDWAVYSHGQKVTSLLYNIRRERRCELMEEGFRMDDLKRWRALDQIKAADKWQPEGINIWGGEFKAAYEADNIKFVTDGTEQANMSSPDLGNYVRPYEIRNVSSNRMWNSGYAWCEAHYLEFIPITHFRTTASNPADLTTSVIYQNPGWPLQADQGAQH